MAGKRKLTPEEAAELRAAMMSGWTLEKATPEELTRARSQVQWMARCLYRDSAGITPDEATREAAKMIHETWTMLGPQGWRSEDIAYWHKGTAWTRRGTPEDDALWENAPSEDGEPQNIRHEPTPAE